MSKFSLKNLGVLFVFLFSTNLAYGFILKSRKGSDKKDEIKTAEVKNQPDTLGVSNENIFSLGIDKNIFVKDTVETVVIDTIAANEDEILLEESIATNADSTQNELEILEDITYEPFDIAFAFDTTGLVPKNAGYMLDYLLESWIVKQTEKPECIKDSLPVFVSDSLYKLRLARLPHVIEMPYNGYVRSMIEVYTNKKSRQLEYMLGISDYYFPIFEQALEANNLPLELKYLPVIESALNTKAVSHMGATGLWQFMIGTGRLYGLEINSLIDERMDPIKSTDAAIRFLKDLYSVYSDWHLAIAAYNCGPGNVNKAIRRSGGKRDFWTIYPYLPRETRGYVPIFIAANYAMNYAKEHNICPAKADMPVLVDTIMITNRIHLEQVSSVLDISIEQIRTLNPQYRRDIIPGDLKPYSLCLPLQYANAYIENCDSICAYRADELVNNRRKEVEIYRSSAPGGSGNLIYHKVKSGETLGHIAARYGTSASKIRSWNNISGSRIYAGQRLKIYK